MHEGIRSEIRTILNTLEKNHPGIKYSLLKSMIEVSENTRITKKEIEKCEKCGYPTFSKTCSVCSLLNQLNQTVEKN